MASIVQPASMMNIINDRLNKERAGNQSASDLSLGSSGSGSSSSPVSTTFPSTLHTLLTDAESQGFDDIICWLPGGQVFKILDPARFAAEIMPQYFNQTKYKSFQRQCNIYGFQRVHHGPHKGGYTHKFFLKGFPDLCSEIKRESTPVINQAPAPPPAASAAPPVRGHHRRGVSLDFRSTAPVPFAPPKSHQRHRRVASWDTRPKSNNIIQEPFDFSLIVGEPFNDFHPVSPLRNEEDILSDPFEPARRHPFETRDIEPLHPLLDRVTPPTPTLPSLQEFQPAPVPSTQEPVSNPLATKMQDDPFAPSRMDDEAFFKDLFAPTELEVEKEILDTFNVGHQETMNNMNTPVPPVSAPVGAPMGAPLEDSDFMQCDSSSVVDELFEIAGTVTVGPEAPIHVATLPTVPEPEPLSLPQTMEFQPQPFSSMISPLANGAVNEHNFPRKLYRLLEDCESNPQYRSIVSWSEDGTSFSVNMKKEFVEYILPNYFDQTQYASFRRQLNMYNFVRQGNTSTYSNPYFIKNRKDLLDMIQRKSVNTSGNKGN